MGNGVSAVTGGGGVVGKELWESVEFWDSLFCDAVAYERELTGMDSSAAELLERYRNLASGETFQMMAIEVLRFHFYGM